MQSCAIKVITRYLFYLALSVSSEGLRPPQDVHVAYSSDNRTFPSLLVSMLSLTRGLAQPSACTVHLIVPERDLLAASHLVSCFRSELLSKLNSSSVVPSAPTVMLHKMHPQRWDPTAIGANVSVPEWTKRLLSTPAAYSRLYLAEYIPKNISRVLWLDTDTIVQGDIKPLFAMQMDHAIAAAYDKKSFAAAYPEFALGSHKVLPREVDAESFIFNSGVMVFDLDQWKAQGVAQSLEATVALLPNAEDQFLLNMIFYNNFDVLGNEWNLIGLGEPPSWWEGVLRPSAAELGAARVLHWTGRCKPLASSDKRFADSAKRCVSDYQNIYDRYTANQNCVSSFGGAGSKSGRHSIRASSTCALPTLAWSRKTSSPMLAANI